MRRPRERQREQGGRFDRAPREVGERSALVYGVLPVLELLRAERRTVDKIYVAEGAREKRLKEVFELARSNGIPLSHVPQAKLAEIAGSDANHQGIVAFTA